MFETFSGPLINDAGDVLFRGFLDTGTGLFLDDGASLGKVVASGDAAPGTEPRARRRELRRLHRLRAERLRRGGVHGDALGRCSRASRAANDGSLWLRDRNDVLTLIVREGMLFELGLGDIAIVESIDFFGDSDARGRGLSDQGWLSFGLTFTDGRSGVFVATPEPGTAVLLAVGLAGLALRRRRA